MTANHSRLLALLGAIVVAAALRLVPHPPNFTPIGAMALFSGAFVVVSCMVTLNRMSALRVGAAALASSVLFFVITNFGMWLFSGFYPRTLAGLEACYVAAVPFFQN